MKIRLIYKLENDRQYYSPKKTFNMKSAQQYYEDVLKSLPSLESVLLQYFDGWRWCNKKVLK